jgi:hypothetical protein
LTPFQEECPVGLFKPNEKLPLLLDLRRWLPTRRKCFYATKKKGNQCKESIKSSIEELCPRANSNQVHPVIEAGKR